MDAKCSSLAKSSIPENVGIKIRTDMEEEMEEKEGKENISPSPEMMQSK